MTSATVWENSGAGFSAPEPDDELRLVGADLEAPCVDGSLRRFVNLDNAATAPCLEVVLDAVRGFLPWYSSVDRGQGMKSLVTSDLLADARQAVKELVCARADDVVIFVRSTTEAINVLATALPPETRVLTTPVEHHANMLPWRARDLHLLPFPRSPEHLLESADAALGAARGGIDLVAVTGASNVTGEVWPVEELGTIAHRHGAELFVDAAQLAPHRPVSMAGEGIDYLAFSGHKLYAPFGAGVLVGRSRRLRGGEPLLKGGGASRRVTLDSVSWREPPARYEAGSPNVVGALAVAVAARTLTAFGLDRVAEREETLASALRARLGALPGVELLRLWPEGSCARVGVTTFRIAGHDERLVAACLGAEHAVGVRSGAFCAHPLVARLCEGGTGAIRASLGLDTRPADVDVLIEALSDLVESGPRWRYGFDPASNAYRPTPDPRLELLPAVARLARSS